MLGFAFVIVWVGCLCSMVGTRLFGWFKTGLVPLLPFLFVGLVVCVVSWLILLF
jgi:hypothetical protein